MRNPTFGSAVALTVLTVLVGCGQADKPTATEQKSTSPTPSTTPDDVSLTLLPNEQQVLTYSDRDAVVSPRAVTVGRNYALYVRCRGDFLTVEVQDMTRRPPWFPRCDGVTNRMVLADGPREIVVYAGGADGTKFTFAVANIKAGAK